MELIRKILLAVEDSPHGYAPRSIQVDGYDAEAIGYHCRPWAALSHSNDRGIRR